jgi:hypothetical protein
MTQLVCTPSHDGAGLHRGPIEAYRAGTALFGDGAQNNA